LIDGNPRLLATVVHRVVEPGRGRAISGALVDDLLIKI